MIKSANNPEDITVDMVIDSRRLKSKLIGRMRQRWIHLTRRQS